MPSYAVGKSDSKYNSGALIGISLLQGGESGKPKKKNLRRNERGKKVERFQKEKVSKVLTCSKSLR